MCMPEQGSGGAADLDREAGSTEFTLFCNLTI